MGKCGEGEDSLHTSLPDALSKLKAKMTYYILLKGN